MSTTTHQTPQRDAGASDQPGSVKTAGSARLGGNTLASILVRHGIIDPCAVEDPDEYDGGITMLRVRTAAQEITETVAPNSVFMQNPAAKG